MKKDGTTNHGCSAPPAKPRQISEKRVRRVEKEHQDKLRHQKKTFSSTTRRSSAPLAAARHQCSAPPAKPRETSAKTSKPRESSGKAARQDEQEHQEKLKTPRRSSAAPPGGAQDHQKKLSMTHGCSAPMLSTTSSARAATQLSTKTSKTPHCFLELLFFSKLLSMYHVYLYLCISICIKEQKETGIYLEFSTRT